MICHSEALALKNLAWLKVDPSGIRLQDDIGVIGFRARSKEKRCRPHL